MDKLNVLALFLSVVEQGSFVGAARAHAMSPSSISKAIARLEDDLNVALFQRTTRKLVLTDSGRDYLASVKPLLEQLEHCEKTLLQQQDLPRGRVKLNLPVSYGRRYIVPLLEGFNKQYPEIELDVSFDDRHVDMLANNVDLGVRSGTINDSSLVARQLSPIDFLTLCSPSYLRANNRKKNVRRWSEHRWLRFRFKESGRLLPLQPINGVDLANLNESTHAITVDDGEAMATLCAQGVGLAQLPHFIARDGLQSGDLVAIAPHYRHPQQGVWLVYHKRRFLPSRVRALIDYLCAEIESLGETPRSTWVETIDIKTLKTVS